MKHADLKPNDLVIFKYFCDILGREDFQDGHVVYVDDKNKRVCVNYLEGHKSRSDDLPYERVVARFNPNGEHRVFGVLSGNSDLLVIECEAQLPAI
jgi:hypothetical protein